MTLTVHLFDIFKAQELVDENEFLRKVLIAHDGAWLVDTDDKRHIAEIRRLFTARRIRYKISET